MATMKLPHKSRNFYVPITNNESLDSLRIPTKFAREHREKMLLNDVWVIVSDEKVWPLGWMVSCDGNIWIQRGWPEFAKHYRLKIGDLLSFNHRGKSVFHVRIFEERYLEPIKSLETVNENDPPFAQVTEVETHLSSENRNKQRSTKSNALEAAKAFMADKPNSFIKDIKASFLRYSALTIPIWFWIRFLTSNEGCVLEVNGRKWGPIECKGYAKYKYARMYGENWRLCRDENHLVVGDVWVFEMVNEIEKVIKVTIFRACGNNSS